MNPSTHPSSRSEDDLRSGAAEALRLHQAGKRIAAKQALQTVTRSPAYETAPPSIKEKIAAVVRALRRPVQKTMKTPNDLKKTDDGDDPDDLDLRPSGHLLYLCLEARCIRDPEAMEILRQHPEIRETINQILKLKNPKDLIRAIDVIAREDSISPFVRLQFLDILQGRRLLPHGYEIPVAIDEDADPDDLLPTTAILQSIPEEP